MKVAGERISWPAVFFSVPDRGIGCRAGGHLDWLAGKRLEQFACEELWKKREKCVGVYMCRSVGLGELQNETKQMLACVFDSAYDTLNIAEFILK